MEKKYKEVTIAEAKAGDIATVTNGNTTIIGPLIKTHSDSESLGLGLYFFGSVRMNNGSLSGLFNHNPNPNTKYSIKIEREIPTLPEGNVFKDNDGKVWVRCVDEAGLNPDRLITIDMLCYIYNNRSFSYETERAEFVLRTYGPLVAIDTI